MSYKTSAAPLADLAAKLDAEFAAIMRGGQQGSHGAPAYGDPLPKGELFPGWPKR